MLNIKRIQMQDGFFGVRVRPVNNISRFTRNKGNHTKINKPPGPGRNPILLIGFILAITLFMVVCGFYLIGRGLLFLGWVGVGIAIGAVVFPVVEYVRAPLKSGR